jgi:hypothetical protein
MPRIPASRLVVPATLALLGGSASAQTLWKEKKGTLQGETFGSAVVVLDDLDGDGVRDLAVSAPSYQTAAIGDGRMYVLSGATLGQIWVSTGTVSKGDHGYAIANAGDVDGDGLSDVLVGAPDLVSGGGHGPVGTAGRAQLRSGANGGLLLEIDGMVAGDMFGVSVAGLSDVDGDGVLDFAVGASGADVNGGFSGSVRFVSGVDGSTLLTVPGPQPGCYFGGSMASMDDLDGDGKLDLIVSATGYDVVGQPDAGAVLLLSGASGAMLHSWYGPESGSSFGASLANLGDVNGDGASDVGIGAIGADAAGVGISAGAVYAYSGASKGLIVARHGGSESEGLGRSLTAIADVSGDGLPDLLAGGATSSEMGTYSGVARIFAGTSGMELGRVYGTGEFTYFGWETGDVGDLDGDGVAEIAVADMSLNTAGILRIYKVGTPLPPSIYCTAKTNSQGCLPEMSAQGTPTLSGADDFTVTVSKAINNKPCLFLWGKKALRQFAFGSFLCIAPPTIRTPLSLTDGTAGPDDCTGTATFAFTHAYMAQQGIAAGDGIHVQAWYRDPALPFNPVGLSHALVFFVVP